MFNVRVTCIVGEAPALKGVIAFLYYLPCPGFHSGNVRHVQSPCALYADFGFFLKEKFQKSLSISGSSRVAPRARQQPSAGATVGQQPVGCLYEVPRVVSSPSWFYRFCLSRFSERQAAATAECLMNPRTQFFKA
jgi:hypothetical protein